MTVRPRQDGFAALADYAVLGDGRSVALAAADGRVDWWPQPALDSDPVFAAILDPQRGGFFLLTPADSFDASRCYLPGTNVLESTLTTATGAVRITQALNTGSAGRLPWSEMAHRVEPLWGRVRMRWELFPGDRFGTVRPEVSMRGGIPVLTVGTQSIAVVVGGAPGGSLRAGAVKGEFSSESDARVVLGLIATDSEPVVIPRASAIDTRLDRTAESWRRWTAQLDHQGPWRDAVERSALAVKTILNESTGAIAAAATTSLPERLGGAKNWDYRFSWVRDSSFALDALISLGLHEEAHGAMSWLLSALRRNGPAPHVFYTLEGGLPEGERELNAEGYWHSRPVRSGNAAASQLQLGLYGDLFDAVHRYVAAGHLLDAGTEQLLADLADHCCESWRKEDSGIWELEQPRHYTISKIGCWTALDRASTLADSGQLPREQAEGWRKEANEIKDWVNHNCWSEGRQAYVFYAGSQDLDAAVLLAGRTGFERGSRLADTIEAVRGELGRGALVYRYSGMPSEEGAFVACTFWMVDALTRTGQLDRAHELMDQAVGLASGVGLLSEQIDPETGMFLGNLPQGLSHLALINAATALAEAGSG
ncbi:MAG: glycoside hydrolase family 15 protein [Candidatus Dormiibacterota bacterium]